MEGKENHTKSFLIQVAAALFVATLLFLVSKFRQAKTLVSEPPKKLEASQILKVATLDKNTGKMKTMWNYKTQFTGNFANDFYNYLKEAEGGLSKDKNDSAYKKALAIKGFPADGYHTNMGITFETFTNASKALKFDGSYAAFLKMDTNVWKKIYDEYYYKPFKNLSSSPLINYTVTGWAWGSGVGGAKKSFAKFLVNNGVIDIAALQKKLAPKDLFLKLVEHRAAFYKDISDDDKKDASGKIIKDPEAKFLDGWLNRLSNYYNIFSGYAK